MFISIENIAKKYAYAYIALFQDELSEGSLIKLQNTLCFFIEKKVVLAYMGIPTLSEKFKMDLIEIVVREYMLEKGFKNLLFLLIKQHRLMLIIPVIKQIIYQYQKKIGIFVAKISTSHALNTEEKTKIVSFIQKKTGAVRVLPTFIVQPTLISGIRIQTDIWLFENSVQKMLESMALTTYKQVGL